MALLDLEIEKLVYGGAGLARSEGRVVLTPYALPGERLRAKVVHEGAGVLRARAQTWQTRSPDRIEPDCPLFSNCGGCHYQHIDYASQLAYKRDILRESLARIGKIEYRGEIETIAGEPWGYRNRTQLRLAPRGGRPEVGFFAAGSKRLVAAETCPINSPTLNRVHRSLIEMAGDKRFPGFLHEIELFTNETDVQLNVLGSDRPPAKKFFEWCEREIEGLAPGAFIDYPSGEGMLRVGSRSFFQVNRFLTERLAEAALGEARGGTALDLYAGVGLMTLPLGRRFERTLGVDSSGAAVRSLQFNAERARVDVRVVHSNVDKFLQDFDDQADFVVADPPRAGLGSTVTAELVRIAAPRLALVSCDPATLARDLAALTAGGYQIESMTMIDLFPQTYHIETVVQLGR